MNSLSDLFSFLKKKPKVTPPKTVALPWRLGGDTTDMPTPDSTSSSRPVEQ